jgi:hypothetical protein
MSGNPIATSPRPTATPVAIPVDHAARPTGRADDAVSRLFRAERSEARDAFIERYWSDLRTQALGAAGLSAEDVVETTCRQVSSIDDQIRTARTAMQDRSSRASRLAAALDAIAAWHRANPDVANDNRDHALNLRTQSATDPITGQPTNILALLRDAGVATSSLMTRTVDEQTQPMYGSNSRDMPALDQLRQTINRQIELNNRDNEQGQLTLQALVNRRGQLLQLATQLLNAMHDSAKNILQNVR